MKKFFLILVLLLTTNICFCANYDFNEAHIKQIYLNKTEDVIMVLNKLNEGEEFETLAKKYSVCPTKRFGGDMGYIKKGTMVKEFDDAISKTQTGKISEPFRTEFGWHLIKVIDKK